MKRIVREFELTSEEQQTVRALSHQIGITETTASILYARGMTDGQSMRRFLSPSKENFLSPFLMQGMKEAKALIEQAKAEAWQVVVFGDYDADGIGALSIMVRALRRFGIEPYLYVPERSDGYGMNRTAIDNIFDECLPDLFITVDCGISNAEEVEYIKEQGAYVIVTDHHELPECLPDCIVVNPKLKDDYPYDNLCGAGVAFKLAVALLGESAYDLLDFCALSTVADSVPLLGENRDIVAEGLKLIQTKPRLAFSALMGKQTEVTAQTLAFTLAPRINAAGRMGDAQAALDLFTSEDEERILALAEKLNGYNAERQKLCDALYERARAQISAEGAYASVVMAAGEDWQPGLVGIVAARIAEEFSRPALLFVKHGEMLRGSARSIERVNIFDALKNCSQYIEEFGGHAQAAGVNVRVEQFDNLKRALDEYISTHYTREDFMPSLYVSGEIDGAFSPKLAEEINRLEPFGVGNRRPMFVMNAEKLNANPVKAMSPHVSIGGALDCMYFWGEKDLHLLRSDMQKKLVFECNVSKFRGKEYIKGFVRSVVYDGMSGKDFLLDSFLNEVKSLKSDRLPSVSLLSAEEINERIETLSHRCAYGLCVIGYHRERVKLFPSAEALPTDVLALSSRSVGNTLLLSPAEGCDLSAYRDVVYLETPPSYAAETGNASVAVCKDYCGYERLKTLPIQREDMLEVFAALRSADGRLVGADFAEVARNIMPVGFSVERVVFALAVFEELGLVSLENGRMRIVRGVKTDLANSEIYRNACKLQA